MSNNHHQTAHIYERILTGEEPETTSPQVHWDIQPLKGRQKERGDYVYMQTHNVAVIIFRQYYD